MWPKTATQAGRQMAIAKIQNGILGGGGYTITVRAGDTNGPAFLDGTNSYDPDGDNTMPDYLTYHWHRNLPGGMIEVYRDPGTGLPYYDPNPPGRVLPLGSTIVDSIDNWWEHYDGPISWEAAFPG